jgi:hypothetical protein
MKNKFLLKDGELICKCGRVVAKGKIEKDKKGRTIFINEGKVKGEIRKNKSDNPEEWTCNCTNCQKKK